MTINHRFSPAEDDFQWLPDSTAVPPSIFLDRGNYVRQIASELQDKFSVVITGAAGAGKNSLAKGAIRKHLESDSNGPWVVCDIGYKELLTAPNVTTGFVETIRSRLKSDRVLGLNPESELMRRSVSSVFEACLFFRELGTLLLSKQAKVVLYFRSFHHAWWDNGLRVEYQASGGTQGQLSDLAYILGVIQKPALDWREDWARSFRSVIAGRNMTDVGLTFQKVSNFRPKIVEIPELTDTELSHFLQQGWGEHWDHLESQEREGIHAIVARNTACLPQSVQAYGYAIGQSVRQLSLASVERLALPPFLRAAKHSRELNVQTENIVPNNAEGLLDTWSAAFYGLPEAQRLNHLKAADTSGDSELHWLAELIETSSPMLKGKPKLSKTMAGLPAVEVRYDNGIDPVTIHLVKSENTLQLSSIETSETTIDARLLLVRGYMQATGWTRPKRGVGSASRDLIRASKNTPAVISSAKSVDRAAIIREHFGTRPVTEAELFLALRNQFTSLDVSAAINELLSSGQIVRAIGFERRFGGQLIRAYRTR